MKKLDLSTREFAFAVATRVALGVGIGLLTGGRMRRGPRLRLGAALVALGALTTIPVAMIVIGRPGVGERSGVSVA
jgi:hypothetical protein